jgi:hypothetical protein
MENQVVSSSSSRVVLPAAQPVAAPAPAAISAVAAAAIPQPAIGAAAAWHQESLRQVAQSSSSSSATATASLAPSLSHLPVLQRLGRLELDCLRIEACIEESISSFRLAYTSSQAVMNRLYDAKTALVRTASWTPQQMGQVASAISQEMVRGIELMDSLRNRAEPLDQIKAMRTELADVKSNFQISALSGTAFSLEAVSRIESRFAEICRRCVDLGIDVHR